MPQDPNLYITDNTSLSDFADALRVKYGRGRYDDVPDKELVAGFLKDYPVWGKKLKSYGGDIWGKSIPAGLESAKEGLRGTALTMTRMGSPNAASLDYYTKNLSGKDFQRSTPSDNRMEVKSYGLMQVNEYYQGGEDQQQKVWGKYVHPSLMTPKENLEYSARLQKQEGWKRWATFQDGKHEPFMGLSNDEITKRYGVATDYLLYIDKVFGAESDTAKAVMLAESKGNPDSVEVVNIVGDLSNTPAINEAKKDDIEDGSYSLKQLAKDVTLPFAILTDADTSSPMYKKKPESERNKDIVDSIDVIEEKLHDKGQQLPDGWFGNERHGKRFQESLGVPKWETTTPDQLDPKRIKVPLSADEKLTALRKDGYFLPLVSAVTGTDWKYSDLERGMLLARLSMEKAIDDDPDLRAYYLWLEDKQDTFKLKDLFMGKNWGYTMNLVAQSWPTMVTTLVGIANQFNPEPLSRGLVTTGTMGFLLSQEGGNAFMSNYKELMEEKVSKGLMTEDEAFNVAAKSFYAVGIINTLLEQLRIRSFAKAVGLDLPFRKMMNKGIFNKLAKYDPTSKLDDVYGWNMLSIGAKQAVGEGIEEWAQGANERFWHETLVNNKGVGDALASDVLWSQASHSEIAAGGVSGFLLGGGVSANLRSMARYASEKSEGEEVLWETEQETDKDTGKNYDEGRKKGSAWAKDYIDGDYLEQFNWQSWIESVIDPEGPFNLDDFKNIPVSKDPQQEAFFKVLRRLANKPPSQKGIHHQILNILRENPNKMGILDKMSEIDREKVMNIARLGMKRRFPDLVAANVQDGDLHNRHLDTLVRMFAEGKINIQKGKAAGKGISGSRAKDKLIGTDKEGQGFLKSMIKDFLDVEKQILGVDYAAGVADSEFEHRKATLYNQIGDFEGQTISQIEKKFTDTDRLVEEGIDKEVESQFSPEELQRQAILSEQERRKPVTEQKKTEKSKRVEFIGRMKQSPDPIKELSSKPATELNKILDQFPLLRQKLKNDPSILKNKNGEINFTAKNKQAIAAKISKELNLVSQAQAQAPQSPAHPEIFEDEVYNGILKMLTKGAKESIEDINERHADDDNWTSESSQKIIDGWAERLREFKDDPIAYLEKTIAKSEKGLKLGIYSDPTFAKESLAREKALLEKLKAQQQKPPVQTSPQYPVSQSPAPDNMNTISELQAIAEGQSQMVETDGQPSPQTDEDIIQQKSEKTQFDIDMESNDLGGDKELEDLYGRAGMNKPKVSKLEQEFKSLSPLAQVLVSEIKNIKMVDMKLVEFKSVIINLLEKQGLQEDEAAMMAEKLLKAVTQKYGSVDNFINRLLTFNMEFATTASEEEQKFFRQAATDVIKGFGSLLVSEKSLKRIAVNPLPNPDFREAGVHFQSAYDNFKKGYENLGWPEAKLFKAFVHGVLKQIRRMRPKFKNTLIRWFKRWASDHFYGSSVWDRDAFTQDHDITGSGHALQKGIANATKPVAQEIVENLEMTTSEGENYDDPDVVNDKVTAKDTSGAGVVKVMVGMKNFIEESSGKRISNADFNDIRYTIFSRKGTWRKNESNEFIDEASNETMGMQEFYQYLETTYNMDTETISNVNIINSFYNQILNQILREEQIQFQLVNLRKNPKTGRLEPTKRDDKRLYSQTKYDSKSQRERSDFVSSNFLDRQGVPHAILSSSDIVESYVRKAERGRQYDEDGNLRLESLFTKEHPFFLDENRIYQIDEELGRNFSRFKRRGIERPAFIVGSKGGKGKSIVIGIADKKDVMIGMNADVTREFFLKEVENDNITQAQADELINDAGVNRGLGVELAVQTIARYRWWQKVHSVRSMHEDDGYTLKEHSKRLNADMADGNDTNGSGGYEVAYFDYNTTYAVNSNGDRIELVDEEGDYIFDGQILTGSRAIESIQFTLGRMPENGKDDYNMGWFKAFMRKMSPDNKDYVQFKGLNVLAQEIDIRDKETDKIILSVRREGNKIDIFDKDGNFMDMIMTIDEAKMRQGNLTKPNNVFRIEDDEIRILQTAGFFSKGSGTAPFQWFDQWTDLFATNPELKPIFDELMTSIFADSESYLRKVKAMRDNPTLMVTFLQSLAQQSTVTKTNLMKMVDKLDEKAYGLIMHPHNSTPIVPMINNRFIVDGLLKGRVSSRQATKSSRGQYAEYSHLRPDITNTVKENEFAATPFHPVWKDVEKAYLDSLSRRDKKDFKKLSRTQKGRRDQVDLVNEFLDSSDADIYWSPQRGWNLVFRVPIQHFANPQMLKIRRFEYMDYGDVMFLNWKTIKEWLQADYDGDTATSRRFPDHVKDLLVKLQWVQDEQGGFVRNPNYEKLMYSPKLKLFAKEPSPKTPTKKNILTEVSNNFEVGNQVGMVQNARTTRAILNFKGLEVIVEDPKTKTRFKLKPRDPNEEVIMMYAPLNNDVSQEDLQDGDEIVNISGTKYLKTTSDREITILMQAAFDESKEGLLSYWWPLSVKTKEASGNFNSFIQKRLWNVEFEDGRPVPQVSDTLVPIMREISKHLRLTSLRQGYDADRNKLGMNALIEESKTVYDRINSSKLEQEEELAGIKVQSSQRMTIEQSMMRVPNARIISASILKVEPHHLETLISMPWKFMVDNNLKDYDNLIQYNETEAKNAHNMTMQEISGTDNLLLEIKDKYNLTPEDISIGNRISAKMNSEFYSMIELAETVWTMRELDITSVKLDHDMAFEIFEDKWRPHFESLSPGARFVATLGFFGGTSTSASGVRPIQTRILITDISNALNSGGANVKWKRRMLSTKVNDKKEWDDRLTEFEEQSEVKVTEQEEGQPRTIKKGIIAGDFKSENDYRKFKTIQMHWQKSTDDLKALIDVISHLESQHEALRHQLETTMSPVTNRDEMSRRRLVMKWMPSDLLDGDFLNLYGEKWIKNLKIATRDEPKTGFEIKLKTFDNLISKGLLEDYGCG